MNKLKFKPELYYPTKGEEIVECAKCGCEFNLIVLDECPRCKKEREKNHED